jgi:hypothetical protein
LDGLEFWTHLLSTETGRYARSDRSGTLIPSFGDGSGTGTGGTVVYEEGNPMEMWMGAYSPRVYLFSSNWKELQTLMATIERAQQVQTDIRGVTCFYFSDYSTTYFVMASGASTSPGLHDMVRRIKLLAIELGITLEVMGDICKQDEPITIEILIEVDRILEREWKKLDGKREQNLGLARKVSDMGAWFVGGFCTGLRGEEMPLVEFSGTAQSLKYLQEERRYFTMVLSGRTKGLQTAGAKFKVPCVGTTGGTGLEPGKWVKRLVWTPVKQKQTRGRLFQRQLSIPKLFEFEDDFFTVLERVQSETKVIDSEMDIREKLELCGRLERA